MAFQQPKHPEQLLQVLPKTYDDTLRMTHTYGSLLFTADKSGDEQLARDLESVLIHLRYRLVQYSSDPPSYEDFMFLRIYEASFPRFILSPVYVDYSDVIFEDTCMVPFGELSVEHSNESEFNLSAREHQDDSVSVVSESQDIDDADSDSDATSNADSVSVVSEREDVDEDDCYYDVDELVEETLTLEECEAGFENPHLQEYFLHSYLDTYSYYNEEQYESCSNAEPASDLPVSVKCVVDKVSNEMLYQQHHGQASNIRAGRRTRGVRRSERYVQCSDSFDLSLLIAASSIDICHREEHFMFYKYNHTRDVSSLNDLAMRAYVRGKLPMPDLGSGVGS